MAKSQRPVWLGHDERQWDHVRVHLALLSDDRLGAYELAAYLGLAAHAETNTGDARPSVRTLARYAACSENRIRAAIDTLRTAGYVDVVAMDGHANRYRLLPPPLHHVEGYTGSTPAPRGGVPPHDVKAPPSPRADEREPIDENQGTREEPPSPPTALFADGDTAPYMTPTGLAELVFDTWRDSTGKARAVLDGPRRRAIDRALRDYPLDDVLDAVRGWAVSPFHRGENDRKRPYHELTLLLRDAAHIEQFRDLHRGVGARPSTMRRLAAAYERQAT